MRPLLSVLISLILAVISQADPHADRMKDSNYGNPQEELKAYMLSQGLQPDKIPQEESRFGFFFFHDFDKDNHLDGNELRVAFQIYVKDVEKREPKLEEIIEWVDDVLRQDDRDGDGKISLQEYLASESYHHRN